VSYISGLDDHEVDALRAHLLEDFERFSHFCFKVLYGTKMITVDYYEVLFHAIQTMIDQESNRMIINIPPRAGKTLIISICLPLYAWVKNPSSHTILTGFNADVLAECAGHIRTIMADEDFCTVFPDCVLDKNKKSVEMLGTRNAGVIHAIPTKGRMTGKGCGTLSPEFAGLMAIDDVIKPDDAKSPTERDSVNNRYTNTLLSRLNSETTPLAIIMQRLHPDDLCGFLMKGGTVDVFDWLNIPGLIRKETGSQEWYDAEIEKMGYTNVKPVLYHLDRAPELYDEDGDSSFWPARKNLTSLKGLRDTDPYTFFSQYMGSPVGRGSIVLKEEDIQSYLDISEFRIRYTFITADTASTTKTYSDPSVAVWWAVTACKKLLVIDMIKGKWETPDLIVEMRKFWKERNVYSIHTPGMKPKGFYMEDASSGLFLNQQFLKDGTVTVKPVPRDGTKGNDKFSRFMNTIPYFKQNQILLPKNDPEIGYMRRELLGMSEIANATGHDDFCDNVSDAAAIAFSTGQFSYENWN